MEIEISQAIFPKVGLFFQLLLFTFTLFFSGIFFYKREIIKKLLEGFFDLSENNSGRKLLRVKANRFYSLRSYLFFLYQGLLLLLLFLYFKFGRNSFEITYNKREILLFSFVCFLFYLFRQGLIFLILGFKKKKQAFVFNEPFYQSIFLQLLFFIVALYFFLYSNFFTFNKFMLFVMIFFLLINSITLLKSFINMYKIKNRMKKIGVLFVIILFDTLPLSYVLLNIIRKV